MSDNDLREATPINAETEEQLPPSSVEAVPSEQYKDTVAAEDSSSAPAAHDDTEMGGVTPPTPTSQAEPKVLAESDAVSSKCEREGGKEDVVERSRDGGEVEEDAGKEVVGGSEEKQGEESAPPTDQQIELKDLDEVSNQECM